LKYYNWFLFSVLYILLIEPFGIEITEAKIFNYNTDKLLIEPFGIEITYRGMFFHILFSSFNRTFWN